MILILAECVYYLVLVMLSIFFNEISITCNSEKYNLHPKKSPGLSLAEISHFVRNFQLRIVFKKT